MRAVTDLLQMPRDYRAQHLVQKVAALHTLPFWITGHRLSTSNRFLLLGGWTGACGLCPFTMRCPAPDKLYCEAEAGLESSDAIQPEQGPPEQEYRKAPRNNREWIHSVLLSGFGNGS